ncbi:hypothetical protein ACJQWK_09625 [Exserohilum turcicum]
MLGNSFKYLSIYMEDYDLKCAQLVSDNEPYQISTLTCGVSFVANDNVFALTSAHAFEDNDNEKSDKCALNHVDSTSDDGGLESDDTSALEDYDWGELEVAKEMKQHIPSDLYNPAHSKPEFERHAGYSIFTPSQVLGRSNDPKWASEPNLDWALVEMPFSRIDVEFNSHVPLKLPEKPTPVHVATPSRDLMGTISSIPSYISGSRDFTTLTQIWTVTLDGHSMT